MSLNAGYLVTGTETVEEDKEELVGSTTRGKIASKKNRVSMLNWTARELSECEDDIEQFKDCLIESLSERQAQCLSKSQVSLSQCLDLHHIFTLLEGERSRKGSPYNSVELMR